MDWWSVLSGKDYGLRVFKNMDSDSDNVCAAIKEYFDAGHGYDVILDMLSTIHNVKMSLRTLKTRLKAAGLTRRLNYSPLPEVRHAILIELKGHGQLFGYRTMWQALPTKTQDSR